MSAAAAESPGDRYRAGVARGDWHHDPAQHDALDALDALWRELIAQREPSLWQRLRGRVDAPHGVYLHGAVGRGKTFLCDLFFEALPIESKRRVHFHRFMQDVHVALRALDGRADPLDDVAAKIVGASRVLVLDELIVGDIGDAMILGNLLRALFERGAVLVTTSNTAPANLYRDGLQRERFLPAIALIERHCRVIALDSPRDWRLRALKQAPVYWSPPGAEAERGMRAIFGRVARGEVRRDVVLDVDDRPIHARAVADGAAWFEFAELCEGPRGVADYIELARAYHTIFVSNVPAFTPLTEDAARRFIELVDELYDRGVNIVVSAAASAIDIYDGDRLRAEFARTTSRLIEMQSEEYLARERRS